MGITLWHLSLVHAVSLSSQAIHLKLRKPARLPAKPPKPAVLPKPGRALSPPFPLSDTGLGPHLPLSADLKAINSIWTRKPGGSSPQAPALVTSKETLGAWMHGGEAQGLRHSSGYPKSGLPPTRTW